MGDPGAMEGPGIIIELIVAGVVLLVVFVLGIATYLFGPWGNDNK
jgi:hypothetical protein